MEPLPVSEVRMNGGGGVWGLVDITSFFTQSIHFDLSILSRHVVKHLSIRGIPRCLLRNLGLNNRDRGGLRERVIKVCLFVCLLFTYSVHTF